MKAVVQRVRQAHVEIDGETVGRIGHGLLLLLCAEHGDTEAVADRLLSRLLKLRIFADAQGRMNRSLQEVNGGLLVVSQFTLAADLSGGNRPSFGRAAPPDQARDLYGYFLAQAQRLHPEVAAGRFAADMQVHLVNDGPVTIPIDLQA